MQNRPLFARRHKIRSLLNMVEGTEQKKQNKAKQYTPTFHAFFLAPMN